MRIGSITDLTRRGCGRSSSLSPRRPSFLPLSISPLAGLSFVNLDNLVPSLRAITFDYFCLQSYVPPYILLSREMIGSSSWTRSQVPRRRKIQEREAERGKEGGSATREEDIATRRGRKGSRRDREIERPFPLDCRRCMPGENQGDFVHMRAAARKSKLEN